MTFSERAKNQILSKMDKQPCCLVASLSAFIRGAGTISVVKGNIGFEVVSENQTAIEFYSNIINTLYGETPKIETINQGKKHKLSLVSHNSTQILIDLGILTANQEGITINLNIDKYLIENECCKKAYIAGAFIGNGSVTIPKDIKNSTTNYHLEYVFSKYQTATDFADILCGLGFMPKLIDRKEVNVVYFKNGEEISELLFLMGATKACFEVKDVIIKKDINNETNRRVNCEMANIDKQIVASENQIKSINIIIDTIGLENIPETLRQTAKLRLENPESTLGELSKISNLTKSCLNHRLRKLVEIANNL